MNEEHHGAVAPSHAMNECRWCTVAWKMAWHNDWWVVNGRCRSMLGLPVLAQSALARRQWQPSRRAGYDGWIGNWSFTTVQEEVSMIRKVSIMTVEPVS